MGLYLNVYMGPYIECTVRDESREADVYGCTSPACPKYTNRTRSPIGGRGFCSTCGGVLGKSARVDPYRPSADTVLDQSDDLYTIEHSTNDDDDDTICLGSNLRGPRDFRPEAEGDLVDLTEVDREAEMEWLRTRFAHEIEKLKSAYDNVEVRWGLHLWYY